eukprot:396608_1
MDDKPIASRRVSFSMGAGMAEKELEPRYVHFGAVDGKRSYGRPIFSKHHSEDHAKCETCHPYEHTWCERFSSCCQSEGTFTGFCSNYVSTSKYTLLSFLPMSVFEQFRRMSNFYFLVIAIMSCAKFSPQSAFFSFMPLMFVVSVSLVTEALEDLKRHREDNEVNSRQVNRFNPVAGVWESIASEDICVGDIIQITDADPEIPAYILLLKTSLPHGICNIETSNLDGETDLKIKQADIGSWNCECSEDGLEYPFMVEGYLESEPPNPRMDSSGWSGTLTIQQKMVGKELESPRVGMGQLILRDPFRFEDHRFLKHLETSESSKMIDKCLTLLALCHGVIPEFPGCENREEHVHGLECDAKVDYQAASPDEKALVLFAKDIMQYYFYNRSLAIFNYGGRDVEGQLISVNIRGQHVKFELYETVDFDSTRKRMSVIVRDPRDEKFKVYCKGADNVIYQRMRQDSRDAMWKTTLQHITAFSAEGLRTLCWAKRILSEEEFGNFLTRLQTARQLPPGESGVAIGKSVEEIENELVLLGATAVEDRLQEDVPETIVKLSEAGMSIWVLTGDRTQTAINIARSCELLTINMVEEPNLFVGFGRANEHSRCDAGHQRRTDESSESSC